MYGIAGHGHTPGQPALEWIDKYARRPHTQQPPKDKNNRRQPRDRNKRGSKNER